MGTVYRRGKKLWVGFLGPAGKWVYRSSGYLAGQELLAEQLVRELEEAVRAGQSTEPGLTFQAYATRWAERRVKKGLHTNAKLDARVVAQHVVGAELDVGSRAVVFGALELREVRLVHVRAFLEYLEAKNIGTAKEPDHLAPRTRRSIYSLVNRIFRDAEREELVERSPCQLERNEWPKLIDKDIAWRAGAVFTRAELERLVCDGRVPLDRRVFYAIAFLGGLREGEISALRWASYDTDREPLGVLQVRASFTRRNKREKSPKSKLPREVPVHPVTAALLAEWKLSGWRELFGRKPEPGDLLVPNRAGQHVTDLNVSDNFGRDLVALGLRHRRFHDARRTFVTLARAGGAGSYLRWVSHGPKLGEMQDTYATPPWEALCREVLAIGAQLRGPAVLLPLSAAGGGRPTTISTTQPEVTMEGAVISSDFSAQGEIRTRTEPTSTGARHAVSGASVTSIGGSGQVATVDRSKSTTAERPFRGGMRIEDEPDPHPASSPAGVRRG